MMRKSQLVLSENHSLKVPSPALGLPLFQQIDKNRAFLKQWLPWLDSVKKPSDSIKFLEANFKKFETGLDFNFGIFYRNELVGLVGFIFIDRVNRVISLGYWLSKSANGKGLMTNSVAALCDYAFEIEMMNRLYIRCATGNRASRNIPERLEFVHEGTQREAEWLYDHYVDHEVYSILAHEWAEKRNSCYPA